MDKNLTDEASLRSEEVQDVLNGIPPWILRYGVVVLGGVILALFLCCYFIKYPDVVSATISISTTSPQIDIISRRSGQLMGLYVQSGQRVTRGQVVGVIRNTASYADVCAIKTVLERYRTGKAALDSTYASLIPLSVSLGTLQEPYNNLLGSLATYASLDTSVHQRIQEYRRQNLYELVEISAQKKLLMQNQTQEMSIAQHKLDRDVALREKGLISQEDYEDGKQRYLQVEQSYIMSKIGDGQTQIQITQLNRELAESSKEFQDKKKKELIRCHLAISELWASLCTWEEEYLLSTPIDGTIDLVGSWAQNQEVQQGDVVFSVSPEQTGSIYARAELSSDRLGKVKTGQRVIIRIQNYPDQEFGVLEGVVKSMSKASSSRSTYVLEIDLPRGLVTNYGEVLSCERVLTGRADIITQDFRLIERLLLPLRKLLMQT